MNEEIEKRIDEMESKDYEFPKRFSKKDYMIVAILVIFCLIMIIWGAYL